MDNRHANIIPSAIGYRLLPMPPSLYCHALGQIARFIHVTTKMYGQVISKQLERHNRKDRR